MARGRPRLSDDEKARRKEAKESRAAGVIAENALAKMPKEREKRNELFAEAEAIKTEQQSAAGSYSAQQKRMVEVFGFTKEAIRIRNILKKCRDGVYEATLKQVGIFVSDMGRPIQLSMFEGTPGEGGSEDAGPIFDSTSAGAATKDMPKRGAKSKEPPPAPADTGKLEPEEAVKRFAEAKDAATTKRGKRKTIDEQEAEKAQHDAQRAQDGKEFDEDEGPVRSPLANAEGSGSYTLN